MHVRKYRWSRVYESAEEELVAFLEGRHIPAERWEAEDGETISDRTFTVDSQLWCAEGQLACTVEGKTYSLQPGDVIDIPAQLPVSMRLSFGGCVCYISSYSTRN